MFTAVAQVTAAAQIQSLDQDFHMLLARQKNPNNNGQYCQNRFKNLRYSH